MSPQTTICIIPARGGSKRIPGKNRKPLGGRPLITYTVETALQADVFSDVVVSSDDEEILGIAEQWGASTDTRPPELAGDHTRFVEVVEEYLLRKGIHDGVVAATLPTCPFRSVDDVREPVRIHREDSGAPFVISMTRYDFPPQLALSRAGDEGHIVRMREPDEYARTTRSQSFEPLYHPNGAIYVASVEKYLRARTFFAAPLVGYEMPRERSFDIDYPIDFQIAECMIEAERGEQRA